MSIRSHRSSTRAAIALILLASGSALAADQAAKNLDASSPQEASVLTVRGSERFIIENLDAPSSPAMRINTDLADKQGTIPAPTPGYELTSRIVVQSSDLELIRMRVQQAQVLNTRNVAVNAHENVPGFAIVDAGSVRAALELAQSLKATGDFTSVEMDMTRPRALRAPTDPSFSNQWHLRNTDVTIADINADGAWDLGYTGSGVTVGILEGALQTDHPDLAPNYNATASQSGGFTSSHATSCAGIAAARGNNGQGGSGLAYFAGLSKQLYGSDSQTAGAFEYRNDLNDIKSNSWGPSDNGTITYLSSIERAAIENTAENGRGGLGTILCWAAGNGGTGDHVEYDPYASHRYTLAIGSVGDLDTRAWYNETGSSMLVVTHSSGNNRGTWTTTSGSSYTSSFGGTSSASPLGAGAVALMLEANPTLTYRDVQHVLINSARKCDTENGLWTTNGAGHDINLNYGFGAIDAEQAVLLAADWVNVGPEIMVDSDVQSVNATIPDNNTTGLTRSVNIANDIRVESVELILNVDTTYVGDLRIVLTSPDGTESLMAFDRSDSQDNYVNYIFTTHRSWDEMSSGDWSVNISDRGAGDVPFWDDYQIRIYGTEVSAGCSPADLAEPFGTLDIFDVFAFLDLFNAGDQAADLVDDDVFDIFDIFAYLDVFNAGCP
ncbi:MAG: S8 family serine peptidase [Phycisphaerales bacterium]|nr:S8 family serine peptidase [Phycisphaerales bacterium]